MNWRRVFSLTFSALFILSLLPGMVGAQQTANAPAGSGSQVNAADKIEGLVLQNLTARSTTDFFVVLTEKADLSPAANLKTKAEKGRFVFDALRATASRSQASLRAELDKAGVRYEAFYISNKILVKGGDRALVDRLAARPDVKAIRANHTFQLPRPEKSQPPAQPELVEPNISFVKADQVWALGVTGDGIVLAGNDTGLDETVSSIARHYRGCLNPPTCTSWDHNYNWWDATGTYPNDPYDGFGHGTHTTGTMVGDDGGTNQIGMAPGAQTIHCKNMTDGGSGDDGTFTECFQWDLAPWDLNGANPDPSKAPDAVNNSWGYGGGGAPQFEDEIAALQAAGTLVEVSAGNEGPSCGTLRSPGDYVDVLTTGSVDHSGYLFPGSITDFSSRGPSVLYPNDYFPDIMAPGNGIRSQVPGGGYEYWGGTSMAGPHATGLIGLIWSAAPALRGQVATTIDIIHQTAGRLTGQMGSNCGGDYTVGPNNDWGYGTIDALAAVQLAIAMGGSGTLAGTVTSSAGGAPIEGVEVLAEHEDGFSWHQQTNAAGQYDMTVAVGTYTVTASRYGYMPETATGVEVITDTTTIQDFSLDPAPSYTVDGTVIDAVTGWPLYARIDIAGYPYSPIWTNPETGYYSIELVGGTAYEFTVSAWPEGYLPEVRTVGPLIDDVTEDFALNVDVGACTAPGYEPEYGFLETFESGYANWSMDGLWNPEAQTDPCGSMVAPFPSPTNAAYYGVDGQCTFDTGLQTFGSLTLLNPIALPAGGAALSFMSYEESECGGDCTYDNRYVEISVDGGATWSLLGEGYTEGEWYNPKFSLNAYAGQNALFRFRFDSLDYIGNTYFGWMVDDVAVASGCLPGDGGLVVGNVYDQNTGLPLNGASVTADTGEATISMATPEDPNVDDGFYLMFVSNELATLKVRKPEPQKAPAGGWAPAPSAEVVGAAAPAAPVPADPNAARWVKPDAIIYDNGPLVTHPGGGAGGADASALQTALGMNSYGANVDLVDGYRIADDFVVDAPGGWQLDELVFFAYQSFSGNTCTFNHVNYQIWNGPPNDPGSSVVFGDTATNRFVTCAWSNIYRVLDTALTNTDRPVMAIEASAGVILPPGTYWLDWQLGGTLASGPWQPPITILGQTTTGNGLQWQLTAWANWNDSGTTTQQGGPFLIDGSIIGEGTLHELTADAPKYSPDTETVDVPDWDVVVQDFYLGTGNLSFVPPSIEVTLDMGTNTVVNGTLSNTGTGATPYEFTEVDRGFVPVNIHIPASDGSFPGTGEPTSMGRAPKAGPAPSAAQVAEWVGELAGAPAFAVDVYPGYNLVSFDTETPGVWTVIAGLPGSQYFGGDFLNADFGKLYVVDYGFNQLHTVDTATGAVTVIGPAMPGGGESWTGLAGAPDGTLYGAASTCSSSSLYTVDPDTGATTAIGPVTNAPCLIDIAVNGNGEMYGVDIVSDVLVQIDPATGAGTVIGSVGIDANYAQGMDFDELTGVLYWASYSMSGELRIIDTGTGNSTPIGAFPGGAEVDSLAIATGGGDVPWLFEDPISGTIDAGANIPVDVTLDAGVPEITQPGEYRATLKIQNDTPYGPLAIPVTMTVVPPDTYGKLEGNVYSLGYCDAEMIPLEGAVVVVTGSGGNTWMLETDDTGYYQLWLDESNTPVTIDVTYPGNEAGHRTGVIITGQGVTVEDFQLRWLQPCLSVTPSSMEVTLALGESTALPLTITNDGAAEATWEFKEADRGYSPAGFHIPPSNGSFPTTGEPSSLKRAPSIGTPAPAGPIPDEIAAVLGSQAYAIDVYPGYNLVTFDTDNPAGWTIIGGVPGTTFFGGDFLGADTSTMYVVSYDYNTLYALDTATAAYTEIGPAVPGGGESWTGLAGAPDGTLYGAASTCGSSTLYTLDPTTGATTAIGPVTNAPCLIDIAVNGNGEMYGVDIVSDVLVQIDPATGAGTVIGSVGINANYAQGMDFDEAGTLFWAAYSMSGELRVIDVTTGGSMSIGPFPGGAEVDCLSFPSAPADILWLSEEPASGTIPPDGGTADATVTFDAGVVTQPGKYYGTLSVASDDPVHKKISLPVTMTVSAPDTYGLLRGIVSSQGYCDENPVPLQDATVIVQDGSVFTLTTDENGEYMVWLEEGTYNLDVSADGHIGDSAAIQITGQQTTTQDFSLRALLPCVSLAPPVMESWLVPGSSETQVLTLFNDGAAPTPFEIQEVSGTVGLANYAPSAGRPAQERSGVQHGTPAPRTSAPGPNAACLVAVTSGWDPEQAELRATLEELGFPYVEINSVQEARDAGAAVMWDHSPANMNLPAADIQLWLEDGFGYIELGDWPQYFPDAWSDPTSGTPLDIQVADPSHPLARGLPSSWTGLGFWAYDWSQDAVGYLTDPSFPDVVEAGYYGSLNPRAVSYIEVGAEGRGVYLGVNVYGQLAGDPDKQLLENAILWSGHCAAEDVVWLSEDPITGTLGADSTADVEVTFTAAPTMTPDIYTATLVVNTDDAFNDPMTVLARLHVVDCVEAQGVDLSVLTPQPVSGEVVDLLADVAPNTIAKPYDYEVDYDDGTVVPGSTSDDPLALQHTFAAAGTYQVTFSVWTCGSPDPVVGTVGVVVAPGCVDATGVSVSLVTPEPIAGQAVDLLADIAPDDADKPYDYTVDFGDGTAPVSGSSSDDPLALTHTYAAGGTYQVTVSVYTCGSVEPVVGTLQVVVAPMYFYYLPFIGKYYP